MEAAQKSEPQIYFNGKTYPITVYLEAYNMASEDPGFLFEVGRIRNRYIYAYLEENND